MLSLETQQEELVSKMDLMAVGFQRTAPTDSDLTAHTVLTSTSVNYTRTAAANNSATTPKEVTAVLAEMVINLRTMAHAWISTNAARTKKNVGNFVTTPKEVTNVLAERVMNFKTMCHALKRILVKTDVQVIAILVIPVGSSLPLFSMY